MNAVKQILIDNPFPPDLSPNIEEILQAFSNLTEVPITFFNNNGKIIWECNSEKKICNYFDVYKTEKSICTSSLDSASVMASKLGEPYVFVCQAGFVKIAVSLIIKGELAGCFMAGPIAMGKISETILSNIFTINTKSMVPETFSKLTLFLKNMKIYPPRDVAYLSTLLNSCVLSAIVQNDDYERLNLQFKEQSKIGEDLQNLKNQKKTVSYPYKTEKELIKMIKTGDSKGALEAMQTLVNEVLLIEAGNLELVRARMLELYSVLSRSAVEGGSTQQKNFDIGFDYVNSLNKVDSIKELRQWTSELIEHFSKTVFKNMYSGNSSIITQAVHLIRENFMHKITLKKIANTLYINPSYLSMHFKHEMGVTFTDYLNDVRIKSSKELLNTTNLSLLDISINTGFEDQSYFTKAFKRIEGSTPREYRKQHTRLS